MKTPKIYFHFLGLKIPLPWKNAFHPKMERRKHRRYYTPEYDVTATEMIIWSESNPHHTTRYKTSIINSSLKGYLLMLRNIKAQITLEVGEIVQLQALSETPTLCERGSIRWLKHLSATDLGIGIHLLS